MHATCWQGLTMMGTNGCHCASQSALYVLTNHKVCIKRHRLEELLSDKYRLTLIIFRLFVVFSFSFQLSKTRVFQWWSVCVYTLTFYSFNFPAFVFCIISGFIFKSQWIQCLYLSLLVLCECFIVLILPIKSSSVFHAVKWDPFIEEYVFLSSFTLSTDIVALLG